MTPSHFASIYVAETRKLFSRLTARLGLVVVGFTAVATILMMTWADGSAVGFSSQNAMGQESSTTLGNWVDMTGTGALIHTLWTRNVLFMGRLFIIALTALSVASEFSSRTLREEVLRPVPRWVIPAAKGSSLATWAAVSLAITFLFTAAIGLPAHGPATVSARVLAQTTMDLNHLFEAATLGGDGSSYAGISDMPAYVHSTALWAQWRAVVFAYVASLAGDFGFIGVTMFVAFATRSVVASIITPFMMWLVSCIVGVAVLTVHSATTAVLSEFPDFAETLGAWPERFRMLNLWLPSSGLELWWASAMGNDWAWQPTLVLILIITSSMAAAVAVFQNQDVP